MKKKVIVLQSFAIGGERFKKGTIVELSAEQVNKYSSEGLIGDVSEVLGLQDQPKQDNHTHKEYVTHTELGALKDELKGRDGFPTEEQWNALVQRVTELEAFIKAQQVNETQEKFTVVENKSTRSKTKKD